MTEQTQQLSESEFRMLAKGIYDRVNNAFEDIDPDEAECEDSQGSLTIELADGAKWILSQQPPVRQLWLAVASLGQAHHFDFHSDSQTWRDDKGAGLELLAYLQGLLRDIAGVSVTF